MDQGFKSMTSNNEVTTGKHGGGNLQDIGVHKTSWKGPQNHRQLKQK